MLRRFLWGLVLALVPTLLVLGVLASLLKPALNHWLPVWLGNEQQKATVVIEHLGINRLALSQLEMALTDDTQLKLSQLTVTYNLPGLLRGQLNTIDIQRLSLELHESVVPEAVLDAVNDVNVKAHKHFNQHIELPSFSQWLTLPAQSLQIQHLDIQHPSIQANLSASATPELWRLHGQLQAIEVTAPWQLELQLQNTGRWFFQIFEQQQVLLQQYGTVQQDEANTHINLHQEIQLGLLGRTWPPLADIGLGMLRLELSLQLPNSGILPEQVQGQGQLNLTLPAGKLPELSWRALDWQLSFNKEHQQAPWQYQFSSSPLHLVVQQPVLGTAFTLNGEPQFTGHCQADLAQCEVKARWPLEAFKHKKMLANAQLEPVMVWQHEQGLSAQLLLTAKLQPAFAQLFELPINTATFTGQLQLAFTPSGQWQLHSQNGLAANIELASPPQWQLPSLQLTMLPELNISGDLAATSARQQLRSEPLLVRLNSWQPSQPKQGSQLALAESELSCRPFKSALGFNASCQLTLALMPSTYQGWPLPDTQITGQLQLRQAKAGTTLAAQLQLQAAEQQLQMRLNLLHELEAQRGNLQWHLADTPLSWKALGLTEIAAKSQLDVLAGSLAGQGWLDWYQQNNQWQFLPDLSLRIDALAATYDGTVVLEGWNALLALRRPFAKDYLLDTQISGLSLNAGVAITNALARSQTRIAPDFSWAVADIYEVRTDLLGGSVRTPLIHYDSRQSYNAFTIELDHLELSQLAALEPSTDIQASGLLDGILPIVLTPDGPQVPTGNLFARDPGGVVRYRSNAGEALAKSNEGVNMAMQLLQDFRYDQLQTGVRYQSDGSFNLALQFQGKNPNFFSGQKTHLNVQLDYNLLDLLASLRAAQNLIDQVESKYPH